MQLKSVFNNNEKIPVKYTADGKDLNPPLKILNPPENSKSFALIVDDPDAPIGTWVHWILFNISPTTTTINENSIPSGAVQGENSWGDNNYRGPSPPSGTHRYFFKIYALNTELDLKQDSTKQELENAMQNHILEKAELIGLYSRG